MKREILFRGKRVDTGEWVYGLLIESKNGECHILVKNYNPIKKQGSGHWYIDAPCFQVHPDTVCQFTGLLDKNGNKIFEGDKLRLENLWSNTEWETFVRFDNGTMVVDIEECDYNMTSIGFIDEETEIEITGNIHDK
mgnify:CR=1 FL=1